MGGTSQGNFLCEPQSTLFHVTLGVCDGGWEIGHARFQGNGKGRELQFSRGNVINGNGSGNDNGGDI